VPFDAQPTLRGPLLDLRPLVPADYDALFAVASDPLIWEQHPDQSRSRPVGFRGFFDEAIASGGALLAQKAGTGEVVGSSRFYGYREAEREVEIGWTFLARACWGGRYNRELKRLMVEHAFRQVERVLFIIAPANYRSQRAVEKLGAVRSGSRRDRSGSESLAFYLTPAAWASALRSAP